MMIDKSWIGVTPELPREGETVEVASLVGNVFFPLGKRKFPFITNDITHWRYPKEKEVKRHKCGDCNNMIEDKPDEPLHYYCPDCLPEENWLRFEEEMPKLWQKVEIKKIDGTITEVSLKTDYDHTGSRVYFCLQTGKEILKIGDVIGWRPIKEKRPDFGKLFVGDLVVIKNYKNIREEEDTGYIIKIKRNIPNCKEITLHNGKIIWASYVKEIIRIDIDKKTFEEI